MPRPALATLLQEPPIRVVGLFPHADPARDREDLWCLAHLAGRLIELEGAGNTAALTLAFTLVLDAQQRAEPVAWITPMPETFFPPDVYESGVDLDALPVVRVTDPIAAFGAADLLLRSGGFGLIAADLGAPPVVPATTLARLAGLARRHQTAMLFLTRPAPRAHRRDGRWTQAEPPDRDFLRSPARLEGSLGSLIAVHVRAHRQRAPAPAGQAGDRFHCGLVVVKDKHRGPVWTHEEMCRGASGLR